MPAFNVVQKRRRAAQAVQKRRIHGDPVSGKVHQKVQPLSVSGKRKRKLFKKWRRDQKEAMEKGLISMEDIEMAVADGKSGKESKPAIKFPMKKSKFQLKKKGKNTSAKKSNGGASVDAMVE